MRPVLSLRGRSSQEGASKGLSHSVNNRSSESLVTLDLRFPPKVSMRLQARVEQRLCDPSYCRCGLHWLQIFSGSLVLQVFDDKSTFTEWFGDSLGKASDGAKQEDEWLETEKRVVVIHRLHQILEPFMLRRQVEDVESKLPPKVCWP